MHATYTIGVDFGTESGRVVVCDRNTGEIVSEDITTYAHGVMDNRLPNGRALPEKYALQHPQDYLDVLEISIPRALKKGKINKKQVIGIGIDFTSSTVIPVDAAFTPLCMHEKWQNSPHAYAKLWKHHGAIDQATRMETIYQEGGYTFLEQYGDSISCEWMFPKILEVAEEEPALFEETTYFVEALDWIQAVLTGELVRSNCSAGFKAFWNSETGFPLSFLNECGPVIGELPYTKLAGSFAQVGERAGGLTSLQAEKLGLDEGTAVAVGIIDAHAAVLGTGAVKPHTLVMVMGTSTCHLLLDQQEVSVPGISGSVKDGIVPGLHAYEAGQSAVGDLFAAFEAQMVPEKITMEAKRQQLDVLPYLEQKLVGVEAGSTGLIALDWHNGNRSPHNLPHATGGILGLTLHTKPEEIFLAFMEATAFGARAIVERYTEAGLQIETVVASGGLPLKNKRLMEIYANVLNRPVYLAQTAHAPAVGAAILGAAAAPVSAGGYDNVQDASVAMGRISETIIHPVPKDVAQYVRLYEQYEKLSAFHKQAHSELAMIKNNNTSMNQVPID